MSLDSSKQNYERAKIQLKYQYQFSVLSTEHLLTHHVLGKKKPKTQYKLNSAALSN